MLFLLRLLLIAFLFYLIIWVARGLFRPDQTASSEAGPQELVRDALTGVFFDKSRACSLSTDGQTLYFSSKANRDAWLAQRRPLQ
jgi:hypothetical protein